MLDGTPTAAAGSAGEPLAANVIIKCPVTGENTYLGVATLATAFQLHRFTSGVNVGADPLDEFQLNVVEADSFVMHLLHVK